MASKSSRKFAATLATCVAVSEKMQTTYSHRPGCSTLKINLTKLQKKSWEYLGASMKDFKQKDVESVGDIIAECSKQGLDNTRSWRSLITYMQGLLANRRDELEELGGCQEKIDMVLKLEKMCVPVYEHFATRNRREDFDEDGIRLMEIFESCW